MIKHGPVLSSLLASAVIALAAVLAGPSGALASGDDDPRGAMLANTCNGCHGPEGTSRGPAVPTIAGLDQAYLVEAMTAFRNGNRPSTIMGRIARAYSEEDIGLIADYFAARPFGRVADQPFDAALAQKGKAIYDDLCEDCHEERGYSGEDAPVLAGQMMPYLANEIRDLASAARDLEKVEDISSRTRRKKQRELKKLIEDHGDAGIDALVAFFGSLK